MKSRLLRLHITSLASLALAIVTAAPALARSHHAVRAGIPQCLFDPSGYLYIRGNPPQQFEEVDHLAIWKYPAASRNKPAAGLYTKGGEFYQFKALMAEWSQEKDKFVFEFNTAARGGVRYLFTGRFNAPCVYARDVRDTTAAVAEGQLVKIKDGRKVAEAGVEFTYSLALKGDRKADLITAIRSGDLIGVRAALARA